MAIDYSLITGEVTTFDEIYNRFYFLVKDDKDFFKTELLENGVTEAELRTLFATTGEQLMLDAVTDFMIYSNYDTINFPEYMNFEEGEFLIKLTIQEISIIAGLMYEKHLMTKTTDRVGALGALHFSDNEMKVWSASSSDMNSFNRLMTRIHQENVDRIKSYKGRDRDTGKVKRFDWSQLGG